MNTRPVIVALPAALILGGWLWLIHESTPKAAPAPATPYALAESKPASDSSKAAPSIPSLSNSAAPSFSPAVVASAPKTVIAKPRVPTKADEPPEEGKPLVAIALPPDFLDQILDAGGKNARFTLPDGRQAAGTVEWIERDALGALLVQGTLTQPQPGFFTFRRQTIPGVAGSMVGNVRFRLSKTAFRIDPIGPNGSPMLVQRRLDQVVCAIPEPEPQLMAAEPQHAPQTHPTNIPIPDYQNGIIPLQSLPGAAGVIYLDFDGETGPFSGWGNFNAAHSGANNSQIKEVWQRVSEDFQAFNLNVTTDRRVFDTAAQGSRQHVIVTPTNTAAPGAGGVAYLGSFNWNGDSVCWGFYSTGKSAAEVISHEVGHTLGLSHDGRNTPAEGYYGGHGSGETGWAPIMGVGYYQNLTQWSRGEYTSANNTEDDISIIVNNNNNVDTRPSDFSSTFANAAYLEILANNSVSNEGIIESRTDLDLFRFTTTGGTVTLTASVVNSGPNLDLLAEICTPDDTIIASSNPDGQINATVTANLAAGEYSLRVSGVGRGDPLADGFTDYGSMGAFLVSGTVANGIKPDRFAINENSANGTAVGTVVPRTAHGGNPVSYAIASGNAGNAFAINPTTGAITVATSSLLDFEVLSTRWDDPAAYQLFVTVTDTVDPLLTESIRVVVAINDINELPTITGGAVTMLEHTKIGAEVFTVSGSDPDRYEFPVFSIIGGNTGNAFAINSLTGKITVAADTNATTLASYTLSVRASDHATPALTATANITITVLDIAPNYIPGTITRTYFEGINGETVANFTSNAKFPNNPDAEEPLSSFDGGEYGDNYGSTIRGYLIPPATGSYTFWIASDDGGELRISTTAAPANATVRATVSGATGRYEWTRSASQQSAAVTLQAGQPYYIEARQKEGGGADHVAVAWQGPGITRNVIPGLYLAPFYQNYAPKVPAATFSLRQNAFNGATVGNVQVTDANSQDTHDAFVITGGTGSSRFGIDGATGRVFVTSNAGFAAGQSYTLQVRATDNGSPALNGTGTLTINIIATDVINLTGIVQEFWTDIGGNNVSALTSDPRYPNAPSGTRTLTSFDSGADYADNYGSRVRAYVIPPTTGSYTFYIASDDEGQLRLSTDTAPANATQIANVATYTGRDNWTTFPSQTSAPRALVAGQRYYIETLQKDGVGGDFVQVAWTGPGIATPAIIPDSALDAFDGNVAPAWTSAPYAFSVEEGDPSGTAVGTVLATDFGGGPVAYAIQGGNPDGAFAINGSTGAITIANSAALTPGQVMTLQLAAQDSGGGIYPLKTATTTAAITIRPDLQLVSPTAPIANIPNGTGLILQATNDGKVGTAITWAKFSGPGTVTFDATNSLTTGATFSAAGAYVLRCTEVNGPITTSFDLTVNVGGIPGFTLTGTKIGTQAITPAHTVTNGVYTINAAGNGLPSTGAADDFYFLNIPASGNVTVTARVTSVADTNGSNSRVGVMIRENTTADARSAFCGITAANGARYIYRATAAAATNNATGTGGQPYWVRLIRSGSSFTAQIAPDSNGTAGTFVTLGTAQTIAMSSNALAGLAVTSGSTTAAGTTIIDRLTISPTPANVGPNVNAGVNTNVPASGTGNVSGTASDDGKPTGAGAITNIWSKISGPGTVGFGNANALQTTVNFGAVGAYVLRLTASDTLIQTFDEVIFTVVSGIEQWRLENFGANAGNPAIAGNLADPDGDGDSNLIEYTVDSDPLVPGNNGIVMDVETIGADHFLRLTVTRNPQATDVTLAIEVTGDLTTPAAWTTTGTTIEINTANTLRTRDNTPINSAAQRNIRLKVTQP